MAELARLADTIAACEACINGDEMPCIACRKRIERIEQDAEAFQWVLTKIRGLRDYTVPTDGRSPVGEVQGWLHVLEGDHRTLKWLLPQVDKEAKERDALQARVAALEAALRSRCHACALGAAIEHLHDDVYGHLSKEAATVGGQPVLCRLTAKERAALAPAREGGV